MLLLKILIYLLMALAIVSFVFTIMYLLYFIIEIHIEKAKKDIRIRNDMLSCIYFFMDMGPGISSVSVLAIIIMPKDVTVFQLMAVFILGIMLKRYGRRLKDKYFEVLYDDESSSESLIDIAIKRSA